MTTTFEDIKSYLNSSIANKVGSMFLDRELYALETCCKNRPNIDYAKLLAWFKEKNIAYINFPLQFIRKCAYADIENGRFDKEEAGRDVGGGYTLIDLFNDFRSHKVKIIKYDTLIIEAYYNHIINNGLLTREQRREWTNNALNWLYKKENATSSDFIYLFKNTKLMRSLMLPHEEILKKAEESIEEEKRLEEEIDKCLQ